MRNYASTEDGRRIYLRDIRELKLNVANDLFNGGVRTLHDDRGSHRIETSLEGVEQAEPLLSAWSPCTGPTGCSSTGPARGAARAIVAKGMDDRRYLLAANFADDECGDSRVSVTVPGDRPVAAVNLEPGQAKLLRL